jgi:hypothetical protein
METYGKLEYSVVTGVTTDMAGFSVAVTAQIALGWVPLTPGPQITGATSIAQTFSRGQAGTFTPAWLITVATVGAAGAGTFTVAGNVIEHFHAGFRFTVIGSTGNDGTYQVKNGGATYSAPNTVIPVNQAVVSATAGGEIIGYSPY